MRPRLRGRTLLGVALVSLGCGGAPSRTASTPGPAPTVTPSTLQQAKRAEQEGRLTDASMLFESMAESPQLATPARLEALAHGAVLRLAGDPQRRDLGKAQAMLSEAAGLDPQFSLTVPAWALDDLLQEVHSLRRRNDSLGTALKLRERDAARPAPDPRTTDPRTHALRSENRQLRDEIKALQAELARKEEALRRTAEKLLNNPPRPE